MMLRQQFATGHDAVSVVYPACQLPERSRGTPSSPEHMSVAQKLKTGASGRLSQLQCRQMPPIAANRDASHEKLGNAQFQGRWSSSGIVRMSRDVNRRNGRNVLFEVIELQLRPFDATILSARNAERILPPETLLIVASWTENPELVQPSDSAEMEKRGAESTTGKQRAIPHAARFVRRFR